MSIRHSDFGELSRAALGIRHSQRAFTLLELLIVIGIILVLLSILVPTISQVRVAAQTASTRQMISRIESSVALYFIDFHSNPGPFNNAQLKPLTAATPTVTLGGSARNLSLGSPVTSTENLYLGVIGGLRISGNTFSYTQATNVLQNGPGSLNPATLKQYPTYMKADSYETTMKVSNPALPGGAAGRWTPTSSSTLSADTIVPEFVDKYSAGMPILYVRANRGAATAYDDTATYSGNAQYNTQLVTHSYANGVRRNSTTAVDAPWSSWLAAEFPADSPLSAGSQAYFASKAASTSGNIVPSKKDEYLLISAGPDRVYGTRDDVTNFRSQ